MSASRDARSSGLDGAAHDDAREALVKAALWTIVVIVFGYTVLRPWPDMLFNLDFVSFWSAASQLRDGAGSLMFDMQAQYSLQAALRQQLATTEAMRSATRHIPYYNPPPLALLFVPLTLLPLSAAYAIWLVVSALLFLLAVALPLRGGPLGRNTAVLLLSSGTVIGNLFHGQVNVLFLLSFSLALLALARGRPLLGGALTGLLWLKPQYAVFFALVFLAKRRWRELAGMAASGTGLAALSLAMVGPAAILQYLALLRTTGAFYPPRSAFIYPQNMVNWRAVLMHVWPGIPDATGSALQLALGVATCAVALLALRGKWEPASPRFARQMLVVTLATIVASPHSHFHGMALLLAPVALALARPAPEAPLPKTWSPLLGSGWFLSLAILALPAERWLVGLYLALAMGLLIVQCWAWPPSEPDTQRD